MSKKCLCVQGEVSVAKGGLCVQGGLCPGGFLFRGSLSPYGGRAGSTHPTGMHSCFHLMTIKRKSTLHRSTLTRREPFQQTSSTSADHLYFDPASYVWKCFHLLVADPGFPRGRQPQRCGRKPHL